MAVLKTQCEGRYFGPLWVGGPQHNGVDLKPVGGMLCHFCGGETLPLYEPPNDSERALLARL